MKHCFNVKVWEEYQRWGEAEGSAEIICNAMTGGRKRGDINFIITNDLSNMLDSSNKVSATLSQNIQGMAIGYVKSTEVIHRFCEQKDLPDLEPVLRRISKDSGRKVTIADASGRVSAAESMFSHAFCLVLPDGRHAVTKVQLPKKLATSKLFRTGVDISER